ncbi:MAG TPA: hypothetical protein PLN93_10440 [Vicinamibacterales bacterium]|nr:hypothetical protein [Vicinamibacterales bacterium]HOQ60911.1 hypothetical protein [Vicinamibacterales bacterium]HPK72347.1 hypothetical protein [Vicinamibacterales bacterium]
MAAPERPGPRAADPAPPSRSAAARDRELPPVVEAVAASARDALIEKRPYLKYAFTNPYNLSLFLGALAAAGLTLNPLLAVVAAGAEALWLLYAPESARLRHLLWDPRFEKVKEALEREARAERMTWLSQGDRARVDRLVTQKRDINRLASQNPSFTAELLQNELVKTDRLVEAFLDMAVTCARYEQYLGSIDVAALDKDRERWDRAIRAGKDGEAQTEIAKKNLAIIMKRFEKVQEIRKYLGVARGQLDLIENSFRLLADQIVTMQSPQELSGQLDELLDGVQTIKDSAADTERMLSSLGLASNA